LFQPGIMYLTNTNPVKQGIQAVKYNLTFGLLGFQPVLGLGLFVCSWF
jgi:hypothetical protein